MFRYWSHVRFPGNVTLLEDPEHVDSTDPIDGSAPAPIRGVATPSAAQVFTGRIDVTRR